MLTSNVSFWHSVFAGLSDEELNLIYWFNDILWSETQYHGAPPKQELINKYFFEVGSDCSQILEKLIEQGIFGLVDEDCVYLEAIIPD